LNFIHPKHVGNASLIAHELAHSWAGDATTLATWNDVWLNEGFATYLSHRILEELRGPEFAEEAWRVEHDSYEAYAARVQPFATILRRDLDDPTAGYSRTSYAKGALFLRALEEHTGRVMFDEFLRRYFARLRWRWVDDRTFLELFRTMTNPDETQLPLEEWLYEPGLPANDGKINLWSSAERCSSSSRLSCS
jgi:aminopeptidase N